MSKETKEEPTAHGMQKERNYFFYSRDTGKKYLEKGSIRENTQYYNNEIHPCVTKWEGKS